MKKNIDILLSVIDNYGDMGFACELLLGLGRRYGAIFTYTLWTDNIDAVTSFLQINSHLLPEYSVKDRHSFGQQEPSSFCISLFHALIPDRQYFASFSCVLRIDYLSLDPEWICYHGKEHLTSRPNHRVIEIIPSPLSNGAGIISCLLGSLTRDDIAHRFSIDPQKLWIVLFLYPETWTKVIEPIEVLDDRELLVVGAPSGLNWKGAHMIPFIDIEVFHHLLKYAHWAIIRGEISMMNALSGGIPFFWDMYKMLGGFPDLQSHQFLDFGDFPDTYRDIHARLNGRSEGALSLQEIDTYFSSQKPILSHNTLDTRDIVDEVKKYIDSFYFSL